MSFKAARAFSDNLRPNEIGNLKKWNQLKSCHKTLVKN